MYRILKNYQEGKKTVSYNSWWGEKKLLEIEQEMTQDRICRPELWKNYNIFSIFKKVEQRLNILNRYTDDIKKEFNPSSIDEKYTEQVYQLIRHQRRYN